MRSKRVIKITALITVLVAVAASLMGCTNYVELFTADTHTETGRVLSRLQDMDVPTRVEDTRILVPKDRVDELRVALIHEGIIGVSDIDLSIIEGWESLPITPEHAKSLYEVQIAEDIRTVLLASPKIHDAHVLVHLGENSPFREDSSNSERTYAAVMLNLMDDTLSDQEVQNVADIIRGSVPDIKYENISITDTNLNYYPIGGESTD